jgi:hypothetical protein
VAGVISFCAKGRTLFIQVRRATTSAPSGARAITSAGHEAVSASIIFVTTSARAVLVAARVSRSVLAVSSFVVLNFYTFHTIFQIIDVCAIEDGKTK